MTNIISLLSLLLASLSPLSPSPSLAPTELTRVTPTATLHTLLQSLRTPATPGLTASPNPPIANQATTLTLTNRALSPRQTYAWQLTPNGATSPTLTHTTGPALTLTFPTPGLWTLTVWERFPNSTRLPLYTSPITVNPDNQTLSADFQVLRLTHVDPITRQETWEPIGLSPDDSLPYGEKVKFQPTSPLAAHFRWRENNQLISTQPTVIKQYQGPNTFDIKLTVYNQDATQTRELTKRLWVGEGVRVLDVLPVDGSPKEARTAAIDGNIAWAQRLNPQEIVAIDVSDPANLERLFTFSTSPKVAWSLAAEHGRIYAANAGAGLDIWVNAANPQTRIKYDYGTDTAGGRAYYGIFVKDDIAYVAQGTAGLKILDVRNPTAPVVLAETALPNAASAVRITVANGQAYVLDSAPTAHVFNVSTLNSNNPQPFTPTFVATLPTYYIAAMAAGNDGYFSAYGYNNLDLYHSPNPQTINLVTSIPVLSLIDNPSRPTSSMVMHGRYLYSIYSYAGNIGSDFRYQVINLVDPYNPYVQQTWIRQNPAPGPYPGGYVKEGVYRDGVIYWGNYSHDFFTTSALRD